MHYNKLSTVYRQINCIYVHVVRVLNVSIAIDNLDTLWICDMQDVWLDNIDSDKLSWLLLARFENWNYRVFIIG